MPNQEDLNINFENLLVTNSDEDITFSTGFSYHSNGFPITVNEPVYNSIGWFVIDPIPGYFCGQGFNFYSNLYGLNFRLENYNADVNSWSVSWPVRAEETPEIEEEELEEEELEAEFTRYSLNRPFLYMNQWYVVMGIDEASDYFNSSCVGNFPEFRPGNFYFCDYHGQDFELGVQVRNNLFGSSTAFRCSWVEAAEPDYDPWDTDEYHEDDSGYSEEREDNDVRGIVPTLHTNIGRTIPPISFEQEFSGDGDKVARALYEEGFAIHPHAEAYHNSEGRYNSDSRRMCYVETDSSCGYELIFDRINLRSREEAERVSQVQTILRRLKAEGTIRLNARCGFHAHVDVSDWGMKEIVSGYHGWNYLEDTAFRFASAFWESHRDEETGSTYSAPVPKGHFGRREIGRILSNRRDSLNFSPILSARGNCVCNATFYEDWENCTCDVRQPTLEFRVFNATLNPRKVRAYLAFCVAFVNKAKSFDFTPGDFPEMRWQGTHNKTPLIIGNEEIDWLNASVERIKFIMNEFPLTNAEKDDILYCLKNSSLSEAAERI